MADVRPDGGARRSGARRVAACAPVVPSRMRAVRDGTSLQEVRVVQVIHTWCEGREGAEGGGGRGGAGSGTGRGA
ncbi:hypothetical protein GCM10010358_22920 [Streptomyces minutiscleroticus]|uniref:Uncharacterized protein n=1 Tax=Streptomyces minutiscleroticus TaxID=68238 RepID=A0A918KMC1_9ACTN|nr:hypothetical protein GCM10010358_22920 [Streptomyces minutiscleroticus]